MEDLNSEIVVCPKCGSHLKLNDSEKVDGAVVECPVCKFLGTNKAFKTVDEISGTSVKVLSSEKFLCPKCFTELKFSSDERIIGAIVECPNCSYSGANDSYDTTGPLENYEVTDQRKAECPYCYKKLKKVPGAKTKCPYCGQFMFVRTRPNDYARVVVTEVEAEKIEEEWAVASGAHDQYLDAKQEVSDMRSLLGKKFGRMPSDNDVKWGLQNKELLENAKEGNWGLYRNNILGMARILDQEKKFDQALKMYLEVCYLDLNGPENTGNYGITPAFDPSGAFLAPGLIIFIERIMAKQTLKIGDVKKIFIEFNTRIQHDMKLPVSVEDAWISLELEIERKEKDVG